MDKHLKALAPRFVDAKFIKLDAEVIPHLLARLFHLFHELEADLLHLFDEECAILCGKAGCQDPTLCHSIQVVSLFFLKFLDFLIIVCTLYSLIISQSLNRVQKGHRCRSAGGLSRSGQ